MTVSLIFATEQCRFKKGSTVLDCKGLDLHEVPDIRNMYATRAGKVKKVDLRQNDINTLPGSDFFLRNEGILFDLRRQKEPFTCTEINHQYPSWDPNTELILKHILPNCSQTNVIEEVYFPSEIVDRYALTGHTSICFQLMEKEG